MLAGFPVLGMKAVLVDGAFHDVDSSVMAFEIAGRAACREGLRKAGARLMEPIMQVRCVVDDVAAAAVGVGVHNGSWPNILQPGEAARVSHHAGKQCIGVRCDNGDTDDRLPSTCYFSGSCLAAVGEPITWLRR